MNKSKKAIKEDRKMILEMINASLELSERLGKHELTPGCNCIACVIKRKKILDTRHEEWKYEL